MYVKPVPSEKLRQGELVTDLIQGIQTLESIPTEEPVIQPKAHAMAIVMSRTAM